MCKILSLLKRIHCGAWYMEKGEEFGKCEESSNRAQGRMFLLGLYPVTLIATVLLT